MIYSNREPSKTSKNQNDILGLIGSGGPVVLQPSSVVVHSDRAFFLEVEMNRPSFQFYPQDWGDDPGLQMCSLEARGLWIEMMRLMHKGEPYGHLQLDGAEPVDVRRLSQYVRADLESVTRALRELESNHVYSKNDEGIIFSRRMIRDEMRRKKDRKRQKRHRLTEKKRNGSVTPMSHVTDPDPVVLKKKSAEKNKRKILEKPHEGNTTSNEVEEMHRLTDKSCHGDVTPVSRPSSSSSSSSLKTKISKKRSSKEERATTSRSPRRGVVYWDPKPTWKPDHPSLETAQLKVDAAHLENLIKDFPDVDVSAEIRHMKTHAIDNPGWARIKRNWRSTLGKWIRREDEKLHDARFKAKQARASPAESLVAQEESWRVGDEFPSKETIAACEKEHGLHKDSELVDGSKTRYCKHNCGYYVTKK